MSTKNKTLLIITGIYLQYFIKDIGSSPNSMNTHMPLTERV